MAPPVNLRPVDFSKTQRIVLLVDLDPLITLENPSSYLAAVTSVANRLLNFPPLSASLSAFKLFFSSLSPIRSAAALPQHLSTPTLSFSLPPQTLDSLSTTLKSISTATDLPNSPCSARASFAASSLHQLIHDYAWEIEKDKVLGEDDFIDGDFSKIRSNLVIVLSPIGQVVSFLDDYLESHEFSEAFRLVKEAYSVRDIHLCWVDVRSDELEISEENEMKNECGDKLVMVRDSIRKMGWGFCSSKTIVLGSALLPLGLIYPMIGLSFEFVDLFRRKYCGELNLEILDVNGMPLECKGCDLEVVNLKSLSHHVETNGNVNSLESRDSQIFCGQDALSPLKGEGKLKLLVKSVHRYDMFEKSGGSLDIVLVRECFKESRKSKKKSSDNFFAETVLDMLHGEMGVITSRNEIPTWEMFLSFLHMKGYWALVSLSSSNGDTLMGSLKPFTAHFAILYLGVGHVSPRDSEFNGDERNILNQCSGSQTDTSTSSHCEKFGDGKRIKSRRHLYQNMTWSSFRKAAYGGSNFDLFDLYMARYLEKSKKLKFLKCWMKQISKVDRGFLTTLSESNSVEEQSANNALSFEPSPAEDEVMPVPVSETSGSFFNNLLKRIKNSLESEMDLQKLAEQVVKSSVHWLCEKEIGSEGQELTETSNDSSGEAVWDKLIKLLLKSPKELKKTYKDPSPSSSSEYIVREYELQILLRMEILRLDVSVMMGESRKQKLMKQICCLLEIIQYLVAGGIHGHISLYDYVDRTIRARYWDEVEDVVKNIYSEMDLLPFGEEDETPCVALNSEDSNHSWRDRNDSLNQQVDSTEGESSQPPANAQEKGKDDDYIRILNEARERRERARRFAPFISKAQDLQRVWAPKQQQGKAMKFVANKSKRKHKYRQTSRYSVVCETPMTANKRGRKGDNDLGNPVSKALFQDK